MVDWEMEEKIWKRGIIVAGMDEVGRGSLAGPVIAGVVVWKQIFDSRLRIDDSKKLTAKQREKASEWIKDRALSYGIGKGSVSEINKYGIVKATHKAFRRAIVIANKKLNEKSIEHLLIDAFYIPYIKGIPHSEQTPIIKGDGKSFSIATASIIAKVYRDNLMANLAIKYKQYHWHENKGYGTLAHREAIKLYGISRHHRKYFC